VLLELLTDFIETQDSPDGMVAKNLELVDRVRDIAAERA
jgi:hypothetical protein